MIYARKSGGGARPEPDLADVPGQHQPQIWAADLFTVQTLTFRTLYVLLFITAGRSWCTST